jgi:hypothetical protein
MTLRPRLARVYRDLGWWQSQDEPAVAGVHTFQIQHIPKKQPIRIGIRAVEKNMSAEEHSAKLPGPEIARSSYTIFVSDERKVFSEQEVTAVVRRAVELQESAGKESYTPGVTAAELERVAKELGIEAKYLQQAISEANNSESKRGTLNLTAEFERVVDTELKPEDFDVLLRYLKPTGNQGGPGFTQVGRTLTGRTWTGSSFANFIVTAKGGRTRINLKSNALFAWLVTIHPATIASLVTLPALASKGHPWMALAIVCPIIAAAGLAFRAVLNRGHKSAKELTDKLAEAVAETAPTPASDLRQSLAASSAAAAPEESETVTETV